MQTSGLLITTIVLYVHISAYASKFFMIIKKGEASNTKNISQI